VWANLWTVVVNILTRTNAALFRSFVSLASGGKFFLNHVADYFCGRFMSGNSLGQQVIRRNRINRY
jgi:hypothetical protein